MSTKNRYDDAFKQTLVHLYHNGKTQASLIKEYGVSQNGLNNIPLWRQMMVKSLQQNKLRNFKNVWLNSKKKT